MSSCSEDKKGQERGKELRATGGSPVAWSAWNFVFDIILVVI